jgi:hypothetical protein
VRHGNVTEVTSGVFYEPDALFRREHASRLLGVGENPYYKTVVGLGRSLHHVKVAKVDWVERSCV